MPEHDPRRAAPAWLTEGGTEDRVLGLLKTGKEAEVFVVERRSATGDRVALLAHKRYRPLTVTHKGQLESLGFSRARAFTNDAKYREGERQRRSRDQRAVARGSTRGRRLEAERWAGRELEILVRAHDAGVTVPYPVEPTDDGMLMQLIGDDGTSAPRLVSARLDGRAVEAAFRQLRSELIALTRAGIVHADLSPYNVLWWHGRLWLIDFPQAVDLFQNPHGFELLHHDVVTMCRWFERHGWPCDAEEEYGALLAAAL